MGTGLRQKGLTSRCDGSPNCEGFDAIPQAFVHHSLSAVAGLAPLSYTGATRADPTKPARERSFHGASQEDLRGQGKGPV